MGPQYALAAGLARWNSDVARTLDTERELSRAVTRLLVCAAAALALECLEGVCEVEEV